MHKTSQKILAVIAFLLLFAVLVYATKESGYQTPGILGTILLLILIFVLRQISKGDSIKENPPELKISNFDNTESIKDGQTRFTILDDIEQKISLLDKSFESKLFTDAEYSSKMNELKVMFEQEKQNIQTKIDAEKEVAITNFLSEKNKHLILQLDELMKAGLLNQSEYVSKKSEILEASKLKYSNQIKDLSEKIGLKLEFYASDDSCEPQNFQYFDNHLSQICASISNTSFTNAYEILISFCKDHTLSVSLSESNQEFSDLVVKKKIPIGNIEDFFQKNTDNQKLISEFEKYIKSFIKNSRTA